MNTILETYHDLLLWEYLQWANATLKNMGLIFFFSGQTQLKSVSENIVQIEQTPLNDYSAHFLKYDLQSSAKN